MVAEGPAATGYRGLPVTAAPAWWQAWRHGLLALALYGAATAGFFWQLLFLPDVSVPKGGGDLASFLYPAYTFAAENLQHGVLPLWNPYLYSGSPFAADMQSGLYYPPNLVAFTLARPFSYQTMEALAVFHYLLAAVGAYCYGRGLGLAWAGAFAVGLIYAFGGFNAAHLAHLNMLAAAAWLPLILLLFHNAVLRGALGWAAAAGAIYGIAVLAGHTQVSLYTALFLGVYWLWALATRGWESRSGPAHAPDEQVASAGRVALTFPVCLAAALGVAAVQLLPLAELLRLSLRADLSYARAVEFAASPLGLITLLVPHFFGDSPADYWGLRWSLGEVYGYAGILTLALAAVVLWVVRPWRRWTAFFALTALLALLLSLGEHTALYGWLYRFVPGFDKVRAAGRFLLLFDFALAVLAGHGIDLLSRPLRARWRPAYSLLLRLAAVVLGSAVFLAGPLFYYAMLTSQDKDPIIFRRVATALNSFNLSILLLALSVGLLLWHRRRPFAGLPYLALALLVLDLFSANATLNPTTEDVLRGFRHTAIVDYLRAAEPARIDTATGAADLWQPDAGLLYGLPDTLGLFNPMTLADYQRYWESLGSRSVPGYDLLNAGYLIGRKDVVLDRAKFALAFDGDPELNVYRNRSAAPRAFITGAAEVLPRDEQLARLRAADFEPRRTVLLEPGTALPGDMAPGGEVRQFSYPTPNEVLVVVDNPHPGYLVLGEVYYPGWRAFVDGREVPILRANYVFRAIILPAGAREVRFVFAPRAWQWGLGISVAALLALGAWGTLRWWFERFARQET